MKRKIFRVCISLISVCCLIATAYASERNVLLINDNNVTEFAEVTNALSNSSVLRSCRMTTVTHDDVEYDNCSTDNIVLNSSGAAKINTTNMVSTEAASTYQSMEIYSILIDANAKSLYDYTESDNDIWVYPENINNKMYYTYLEKGETIESARARINQLTVSDKHKEKMIEKAKERSGKWYVCRVEEQRSTINASNFVDYNYINSTILNENVGSIIDAKYVFIKNCDILA